MTEVLKIRRPRPRTYRRRPRHRQPRIPRRHRPRHRRPRIPRRHRFRSLHHPLTKPKPKPIVVPAGTILTVRLQEALSSKTNSQGDPFNATLAQPLVVGGKSVVPAGSSVSGTVTEAHKAGRFKGGATLDIALNTIAIGSHTYQISTLTMSQTSKGKGKRTAVMAGGGAGVGALIGGLASWRREGRHCGLLGWRGRRNRWGGADRKS